MRRRISEGEAVHAHPNTDSIHAPYSDDLDYADTHILTCHSGIVDWSLKGIDGASESSHASQQCHCHLSEPMYFFQPVLPATSDREKSSICQ